MGLELLLKAAKPKKGIFLGTMHNTVPLLLLQKMPMLHTVETK
jgi:hypothetical protein